MRTNNGSKLAINRPKLKYIDVKMRDQFPKMRTLEIEQFIFAYFWFSGVVENAHIAFLNHRMPHQRHRKNNTKFRNADMRRYVCVFYQGLQSRSVAWPFVRQK